MYHRSAAPEKVLLWDSIYDAMLAAKERDDKLGESIIFAITGRHRYPEI
jgi:hypothetical protein